MVQRGDAGRGFRSFFLPYECLKQRFQSTRTHSKNAYLSYTYAYPCMHRFQTERYLYIEQDTHSIFDTYCMLKTWQRVHVSSSQGCRLFSGLWRMLLRPFRLQSREAQCESQPVSKHCVALTCSEGHFLKSKKVIKRLNNFFANDAGSITQTCADSLRYRAPLLEDPGDPPPKPQAETEATSEMLGFGCEPSHTMSANNSNPRVCGLFARSQNFPRRLTKGNTLFTPCIKPPLCGLGSPLRRMNLRGFWATPCHRRSLL